MEERFAPFCGTDAHRATLQGSSLAQSCATRGTAVTDFHYRHGDKVLVVYFDGHVGEMTKADILEIDKWGGANNAFWKRPWEMSSEDESFLETGLRTSANSIRGAISPPRISKIHENHSLRPATRCAGH
jgi:prepilin-type processing-associated H-X9-DG protein